jgi:hypothetical protein
MNVGTESAVRAALALAADYQRSGCELTARVQADIVAEVWIITDCSEAKRRRDAALRRAFNAIGDSTPVRIFHGLLQRFHTEVWPTWGLSARAPEGTKPFNQALFDACTAARAGAIDLPAERQLRRILFL